MPAISAARWRLVSPLLDQALMMSTDERNVWLASLRVDQPVEAADLEALLADRQVLAERHFLETPLEPPAPASLAGQRLGPYTLESLIGRGGMGTVWLARRSDGRFEGRAAVKLLNHALVGRSGEERFRREGSFVARLTHPHIAHLIDAGVSPDGQPYLVLEYVEGSTLDQYCNEHGLSIEARIRIFLDVLAAVAHAHAQLIVHRDLKPSNVMVTSGGQVKLLDFGIATLLEAETEAGGASALTEEGGWALTPRYAAPEQVTRAPVTTGTDVYALGVLLYELLSGQHPTAGAGNSPAELIRAVVETDSPRLSDVVTTSPVLAPDTLSFNAAQRATTTHRLQRLLSGDLDTIVAKALKKIPHERYASVGALAEDLRRYLDHQPIRAHPDTVAYRTAKFVRRHRAPVALTVVTCAALIAGVVGTLTQAHRATEQAALADTERHRANDQARAANEQRDFALRQLSRAEAINDLNGFLLSDAAPSGKLFSARELLKRAEHLVERQRDTVENRIELRVALGLQFKSLDEDAIARRLLVEAYELARQQSDRALKATAACALGSAVVHNGEPERAEALLAEGLSGLPETPQFTLHRIGCLLNGSEIARERGETDLGIIRVEAAQRLIAAFPVASSALNLRATSALAESYRMAGRDREASAAFERAAAELAALGRDETESAGTLLNNWGLTLYSLGRPVDAERLFRRAVQIASVDGTETGVSPMLMNNLSRTLNELNRLPEARHYAEAAFHKARQSGDEAIVSQSMMALAVLYRKSNDLGRASTMLAELGQRWRRMFPAGHSAFANLTMEEADLAAARGKTLEALALADRAIAISEATPDSSTYLPRLLLRRAELRRRANRLEDGLIDATRAVALIRARTEPGALSSGIGRAHLSLGRILVELGRTGEARAALTVASEHFEATLGTNHPETRLARQLASGL